MRGLATYPRGGLILGKLVFKESPSNAKEWPYRIWITWSLMAQNGLEFLEEKKKCKKNIQQGKKI